ncbi:MAG: bifunctional adenosylcobinamide kinase/adenosylcobinamide-phosphate guanylyltransferase [Gemmatimonas sp.]
MIVLVLGGVASGKSAYAERIALELTGRRRPLYIATADRKLSWADPEMMRRIERHRERRGRQWELIEVTSTKGGTDLTGALKRAGAERRVALVDCLTLWLGNLMHESRNVANQQARLIAALERATAPVVLVSDEVGLGGIADNPLARAFADAQGALNQAVARVATRVVFVAAGLPLVLKDISSDDTSSKDRTHP